MHPLVFAAMAGGVTQIPNAQATDTLEAVVVGPGGNRPIVGLKFTTTGDIEEATGNTGSALSYSKIGEWVSPVGGLVPGDWEVQVSIVSEDTGDPGTWGGTTTGSYFDLGTERTYTWTKDGSDAGTANTVFNVTVRNVADTSNSDTQSNVDYDATIEVL